LKVIKAIIIKMLRIPALVHEPSGLGFISLLLPPAYSSWILRGLNHEPWTVWKSTVEFFWPEISNFLSKFFLFREHAQTMQFQSQAQG